MFPGSIAIKLSQGPDGLSKNTRCGLFSCSKKCSSLLDAVKEEIKRQRRQRIREGKLHWCAHRLKRNRAKLSSIVDSTSHPLNDTVRVLRSSISDKFLHPLCRKQHSSRSFVSSTLRLNMHHQAEEKL